MTATEKTIVAGQAERKLKVVSQVNDGEEQAMRAFLAFVPVVAQAVDGGIITKGMEAARAGRVWGRPTRKLSKL